MARLEKLKLDDQLCFALYAATNVITRAYRPLLRRLGITYPQYLTLMVLWEAGASCIGDIAARLALPGHAITPIVDRLEAAGLVERRRDDRDRRVVLVSLTPAGVRLELAAARVQRTVVCQTGLSPRALRELRVQLHQVVDEMSPESADEIAREIAREGSAS